MLFRALAAWALLTILVPAGAVWAVVLYQIDDGSFDAGAMNSSDGSEARDNWMGNLFTIVPGGETITQVQFQVADYSRTFRSPPTASTWFRSRRRLHWRPATKWWLAS